MSKKEFKQAPKPSTNTTPCDEAISAFEKNGIGQDSRPQSLISANEVERLIRISVDIPKSDHIRFKTACSANSTTMVSELKAFIQERVLVLEKAVGISRK